MTDSWGVLQHSHPHLHNAQVLLFLDFASVQDTIPFCGWKHKTSQGHSQMAPPFTIQSHRWTPAYETQLETPKATILISPDTFRCLRDLYQYAVKAGRPETRTAKVSFAHMSRPQHWQCCCLPHAHLFCVSDTWG